MIFILNGKAYVSYQSSKRGTEDSEKRRKGETRARTKNTKQSFASPIHEARYCPLMIIGREQLREMERKKREEERMSRERRRRDKRKDSPERRRSRSKEKAQLNTSGVLMTEKEIEYMKKQYLGLIREKKKLQKPSEMFHTNFVFDWDESEDTSKDISDLYSSRKDPHLLFGKGHLGGIDPTLRKNHNESSDIGRRSSKDVHWSRKKVEEMTSRDWRIFREDNDISLKGTKAPFPFRSWEESNLPDYILKAISRMGYKKPTEIQMQGIPIGIEQRDLIAIAPTGSGKSCAYLTPLIYCLASMPPLDMDNFDDGPRALILTPTRELAIQIAADFEKLAHYAKLTSALVIGGVMFIVI